HVRFDVGARGGRCALGRHRRRAAALAARQRLLLGARLLVFLACVGALRRGSGAVGRRLHLRDLARRGVGALGDRLVLGLGVLGVLLLLGLRLFAFGLDLAGVGVELHVGLGALGLAFDLG